MLILIEVLPTTVEAYLRDQQARALRHLTENCLIWGPTIALFYADGNSELERRGPRELVTVRSLMDYATSKAKPESDELCGFINSDVFMCNRRLRKLGRSSSQAVLLPRYEFDSLSSLTYALHTDGAHQASKQQTNDRISTDGWLVRPSAWKSLRPHYSSDFLVGEPWWDTAAIALCRYWASRSESWTCQTIPKVLYHQKHRGEWRSLSDEALRARNAHFNLLANLKAEAIEVTK